VVSRSEIRRAVLKARNASNQSFEMTLRFIGISLEANAKTAF
jgi:hypothetical protein